MRSNRFFTFPGKHGLVAPALLTVGMAMFNVSAAQQTTDEADDSARQSSTSIKTNSLLATDEARNSPAKKKPRAEHGLRARARASSKNNKLTLTGGVTTGSGDSNGSQRDPNQGLVTTGLLSQKPTLRIIEQENIFKAQTGEIGEYSPDEREHSTSEPRSHSIAEIAKSESASAAVADTPAEADAVPEPEPEPEPEAMDSVVELPNSLSSEDGSDDVSLQTESTLAPASDSSVDSDHTSRTSSASIASTFDSADALEETEKSDQAITEETESHQIEDGEAAAEPIDSATSQLANTPLPENDSTGSEVESADSSETAASVSTETVKITDDTETDNDAVPASEDDTLSTTSTEPVSEENSTPPEPTIVDDTGEESSKTEVAETVEEVVDNPAQTESLPDSDQLASARDSLLPPTLPDLEERYPISGVSADADATERILRLIEDWLGAWLNGDYSAYASLHLDNFQNEDGMQGSSWRIATRQSFGDTPGRNVQLDNITIRLMDASNARIRFNRSRSDRSGPEDIEMHVHRNSVASDWKFAWAYRH
ncbi:MAG: hypothetical protein AAF402_16740 [Pseudomonadota bacterium]